mgnify:CR=1 FL=1
MEFSIFNWLWNGGTSMKMKNPDMIPFMVQAHMDLGAGSGVGCNSKQLTDGTWEFNWEEKEGFTPPTYAEIKTRADELQAEWDTQAYARTRQPLYPDIGDQLDDLYHKGAFSTEMSAKIKKVKDDNPKPE